MIEASVFGMFGGLFWTLKAVLFGWGTVLGLSVGALVAIVLIILLPVGFVRLSIVIGVSIGAVVFAAYAGGVTKCKAYADNAVRLANAEAKIKALEAEKIAAGQVQDFEAKQFPELEAENEALEERVRDLERDLAKKPSGKTAIVNDCPAAATEEQMRKIEAIR